MKSRIVKSNSDKALALVEYLRHNFEGIPGPENLTALTIRLSWNPLDIVRFEASFLGTEPKDKDEVADKPEPSEAETENIRRKFYQAHVGPK